ncbi:MAG: protein kinase domain-containing protein [Polyangia bacterium]
MSTSDPAAMGPPEAPDVTVPSAPSSVELEIDSELQPGTWVGEYQIESKLGQGGMATVYAGLQPVIGKKVAVKVMARHLCIDPVQVERFVQEARAVNQIGHPNIVDVFAFGALPDGRSYFVMEWLQGETLAARLRRGWLSVPEAVAITFQICDGLAAAHDKGIVHRDLKPENVFLVPVRNRRMLVKLLDFGIAKLLGRRDARVDRTADGMTPGTPSYMSPEQTRGKDVDHRTDIYSLGVTAFEMFCGRRPYLGQEPVDILYQHVHAVPPAPSSLRPDIPLQLERLIVQMLEKKADRRPTIPVIEERLAEVRDGMSASLGDTGPSPVRALEQESGKYRALSLPTPREPTDDVAIPRSGPPRALLLGAALLLAVGVVAAIWKLANHEPPAVEAASTPATPIATPNAPTTPTEPTVAAAPSVAAAAPAPTQAPARAASPAKAGAHVAPSRIASRRHEPRHDANEAPPASTTPSKPNRDYMIDPFATPKK